MESEERFYPHLPQGSYTAQRLEHAKPAHLHATSRRVFVGPVPVEWLKSRSSRWFKGDVKIRRADTFTPHTVVGEGRRVTMLSIPRRENTHNEADWESDGGDDADGSEDPSEETGDSAQDDRRRWPFVEADTYWTAREIPPDAFEPESEASEAERDITILPSEAVATSVHTNHTATESVVTGEGNAQDSLASLLQHQKGAKSRKAPRMLPSALKKNGTASSSSGKSASRQLPKNTVPRQQKGKKASGAMVRFSTMTNRTRSTFHPKSVIKRRSLRRPSKKSQGEIIKMEKMLVRVEYTSSALSDDFDENETMGIETRVIEKWREFVVVCRDAGEEIDTVDVKLQLYKTRAVPKEDTDGFKIFGNWTRQILLDRKDTRCNLFSTLDKTLVIYAPYRSGTILYILRPHSVASSVEWYTFIRDCLGWERPQMLEIAVPDLSVNLKIANPFDEELAAARNAASTGREGGGSESSKPNAAKSLLRRAGELLSDEKEWEEVLAYWKKNEVLGLAWRRYDRIEWVYGINEHRMYGTMAMSKTHELELRPKVHYPTEVELPNGRKMPEPLPIEGFLIRLTSSNSRPRLGQIFIRRHYFYTHNHLLFFCKPQQALPPPPPNIVGRDHAPTHTEIAEMTPLIYSVTPYALDENGEIGWLSSPVASTVKTRDMYAFDEAERNVNNVLAADGFVDLTQISEIRLVPRFSKLPQNTRAATAGSTTQASENEESETEDDVFEILMENGLTLRLQAFSLVARDEWIDRLSSLTTYWKSRLSADKTILRRVRTANLDALHVDEHNEAYVGQFARKWEVTRSIASSTLHHFCSCASCRTITFSGPLYRKPRKHSTFRKCHVVLVHGQLLVFQDSFRTWAGTKVPHVQAERYNTLGLENCYVYSGLITESELLDRSTTSAASSSTATSNGGGGSGTVPGRSMLPKIYPDGFTSSDEDSMTTFVVWHGLKRSWVRSKDWQGNTVHKRVTSLGSSGTAVTFKAPCRVYRDLWVENIQLEIERAKLIRGEELDLEN